MLTIHCRTSVALRVSNTAGLKVCLSLGQTASRACFARRPRAEPSKKTPLLKGAPPARLMQGERRGRERGRGRNDPPADGRAHTDEASASRRWEETGGLCPT